jgi:hypothetical protein
MYRCTVLSYFVYFLMFTPHALGVRIVVKASVLNRYQRALTGVGVLLHTIRVQLGCIIIVCLYHVSNAVVQRNVAQKHSSDFPFCSV